MIPVGTRLTKRVEPINQGIVRSDWTLSDERRSICPVAFSLGDAMPVLHGSVSHPTIHVYATLTTLVIIGMEASTRLLTTEIEKLSSCHVVW